MANIWNNSEIKVGNFLLEQGKSERVCESVGAKEHGNHQTVPRSMRTNDVTCDVR